MSDYKDQYDTNPNIPYGDKGNRGYTGPIIALAVIALLIGGVFFLSSGPSNVDINSTASVPAATDTAPAAIPVAPAEEPQPAAPATAQ